VGRRGWEGGDGEGGGGKEVEGVGRRWWEGEGGEGVDSGKEGAAKEGVEKE
jgi:hypothetical protein